MLAIPNHILGMGPRGFYKLFYKEWGTQNTNVLVCAPGFTRNSGDFDYFAHRMQDLYRIACPDMPGRGQSDWLAKGEYNVPLYISAATALLARLNTGSVDWLGTSMGGLLGMILAAQQNTPIRKLVLNDVGAFASRQSQLTIGLYAGNDERFTTFDEVVAYFKNLYAAWGDIAEGDWVNIARHSSHQLDNGTYSLAYDPNIVAPLKENQDAVKDVDVWALFESIQVPMLLLHGSDSTVLPTEIAEEMKRRNKNLELVHIPGVGHCPSLMDEDQVQLVRTWLQK